MIAMGFFAILTPALPYFMLAKRIDYRRILMRIFMKRETENEKDSKIAAAIRHLTRRVLTWTAEGRRPNFKFKMPQIER
ncbi:MAG: hypothetical protein KGR98_08460 [Verrucomicrobia bacterium]|nr:hypothetical protein [Verrucomicrobiota bacterium]MDE3100165.1 hypothetical protein [Verrucomicrobiota bacterium]